MTLNMRERGRREDNDDNDVFSHQEVARARTEHLSK